MVLFRPARPGDRAAMEEVWQLSFGDRPGDIDRFFRLCGGWVQSMVLEEAGQVRGAVPLLPVCFKSDSLLTHSGAVENARPTAANIFYNFPDWVLHFAQPAEESAP